MEEFRGVSSRCAPHFGGRDEPDLPPEKECPRPTGIGTGAVLDSNERMHPMKNGIKRLAVGVKRPGQPWKVSR